MYFKRSVGYSLYCLTELRKIFPGSAGAPFPIPLCRWGSLWFRVLTKITPSFTLFTRDSRYCYSAS